MRIAPVADVKARLSKYLEMCAEGPIVVTKNGRPTAVLLAISDQDELERLILAHTPRFRSILAAARHRISEGQGITHREFWRTLEKRRRRRDHRGARRSRQVSRRRAV